MNLTPEQRETGKLNYYGALGVNRRDFLKGVVAAGAVSGAGLGAMYFGYDKITDPVRVGVIGTGDEGQVLIGACNPDFIEVVAIADIRPSSIHRAFYGDYKTSGEPVPQRPGLMKVYRHETREAAEKDIRVYTDYKEMLNHPGLEAVIIALPLHLHAEASIAAMEAGKHVITEKLMAHTVMQCKQMNRKAAETGKVLAVGHQRHYSVLYENAVSLIRGMMVGELHHIRAQWHRNNLPGADSWQMPIPGGETRFDSASYDKVKGQIGSFKKKLAALEKGGGNPEMVANYLAAIRQYEELAKEAELDATAHGYLDKKLDGRNRSAMEELVRWRLWNRTGGGQMAELGSHQLDAASIFVSAWNEGGEKAHPISLQAFGGRQVFPFDREIGDHVYCMFEFPAPGYEPPAPDETDYNKLRAACLNKFGYFDPVSGYPKDGIPSFEEDANKRITVSYSSINGNGYGGYGEVVMGTKRSLVIDREKDVMLFDNRDTSTRISVKEEAELDTQESGPPEAVAQAATGGPVSRGYTEELEHWAYCIRHQSPENQPRCHGKLAMADAVIALTTKLAMNRANKAVQSGDPAKANSSPGGFVMFDPEWFEVDSDRTPEEDLA